MSSSSNEIIKAEDFRSIQVVGKFFNQTSKLAPRKDAKVVSISKEQRIKNAVRGKDTQREFEKLNCELIEFLEEGFVLEVPARSCAVGHELQVTLEILNAKPGITFNSTVKVTDTEVMVNERQKVSVRFVHVDEKEWLAFQEFFNNTQDQLLELFHSIRGH